MSFLDPLSALVQAAITAAPNSTEDGAAVKEEDQANGVKSETDEKPVRFCFSLSRKNRLTK